MNKPTKIVEHEPIIITTAGAMTQAQLDAFNKERREFEAEARAKELSRDQERTAEGSCPLSTGVDTRCRMDKCAWYTGEGCAQVCPHPAQGKRCPYSKVACAADCAWATTN